MVMEDRFKFRVWAKPHEPTKTEGYYVDDADYMVMTPDGEVQIEYYCDNGYDGYIESFEQDEVIIEQCTGLKDKNGKLIYEGDIFEADVLNSFDGDELIGKRIRGQVAYYTDGTCFTFARYTPFELGQIEVIGNIHEDED